MAEISINITIYNSCVPLQILDNLKNPMKNEKAPFTSYSANADVAFFVTIFVLVILRTTSQPMYCYF